MWIGFTQVQKANPYHDADGKFTSADGVGSGAGKVSVSHGGQNYTVHYGADGSVAKVVGHYALSKNNPGKITDYVMHDASSGKDPSPKIGSVIAVADDAKSSAAPPDMSKTVPLTYQSVDYNVHYGADGQVDSIQSAKTGATVWSDDSGKPMSAYHMGLVGAADKVSPTFATFTGQSKPAQATSIDVLHEGKPYTVTYDQNGQPSKIISNSLNGQPAPPFTTWDKSTGESPHSGQQQIIAAANKQFNNPAPVTVVSDGTGKSYEVSNPGAVTDDSKPLGVNEKYEPGYEETRSYLENYGAHLENSMSYDQRYALSTYMGAGYRVMNGTLRSGQPSSIADTSKWNDDLLAAFDNPNAVLPKNVVANRGINTETLNNLFPEGLTAGSVLSDKGFLSTSWDRSFSKGWADNVFQFTVAKGSKAIIPADQSEREIIFPPNSAIRIDSIETFPNSSTRLIKGTYLGTLS